MVRFLKWLAGGIAVLVLFVVAVYLVSRAMGPSQAEREAVALIDAPVRLPPGRDGFSALYTARHDVPSSEQARVLAEDVRRFAATSPLAAQETGEPAWHSTLDDWPILEESGQGDVAWCSLRDTDCLGRVRASADAYAGLLERNARQLDRAAALTGYDYFLNPFQPRFDMPLPAYQVMTRLATRHAWRFATGQVDLALAGACGDVAMGRRMIEVGDSLIGSMIGSALVQGGATLLAQMLAELPRDHPLPAQCGQAFEWPMALDEGVCRTMLGEARFSAGGLRTQVTAQMAGDGAGRVPDWASRLLFDPERTVARTAPTFAWYCGAQARSLLARDQPLRDPTPPPSRWSLGCASNAIGCVLADIARPAYSGYGRRLQDADARLRTTAALLWLRGQEGAIDAAALARVPAPMRSEARPFRLDLVGGTLGIGLYEEPRPDPHGHDGTWSVPLPASRLRVPGASP